MSGKVRHERRTSGQAVTAKTGRSWDEWFTLLRWLTRNA